MEKIKIDFKEEKNDRELILFDKGFSDLSYNAQTNNNDNNNYKRKRINWFTVYLILFKNTLSSKNLVPKDELKLRLNIIRKFLPQYYNCQKITENLNTNSILKKFTYHLYSKNTLFQKIIDKKNTNKLLYFDEENEDNIDKSNFISRRRSKTRTEKFSSKLNLFFLSDKKTRSRKSIMFFQPKLKIVEEYNSKNNSLEKRTPVKRSTLKGNENYLASNKLFLNTKRDLFKKTSLLNKKFLETEKNIKVKFDKKNNELNNIDNNNKEILIRTPNDNEYPLILTEKRMIKNNNPTYFLDFLNKLNDETKNEKINTFKKEVTSQILKFNEMYFDTKIDDFSNDNLFNELKDIGDLFINKFNLDKEEEKNLGDLDKFL